MRAHRPPATRLSWADGYVSHVTSDEYIAAHNTNIIAVSHTACLAEANCARERRIVIVTDLRAFGPAMFDRFNAPKEETLWYYASLSKLFLRRLPGALAEELAETVTTMQRLAT